MNFETQVLPATEDAIAKAVTILRQGGVVAFPTDTVYGLCCDLCNVTAVERIYQIKGRPARMPLIAMFATPDQWDRVATSLSPRAQDLIKRFWPGPLTVIAQARPEVPQQVLGGGTTIGMRIPDNAVARRLLELTDRPLATTSANLSGHSSPCTAADVVAQLYGRIELVLDAGACAQGQASTVIDCSVDPPKILREGPLSAAELGL